MELSELYKLSSGAKLRIKGTNTYVKIVEIDCEDSLQPLKIGLISADGDVFVDYSEFHGGLIMLDFKDSWWIYRNDSVAQAKLDLSKTEFEDMTEGYIVATLENLELADQTKPDLDTAISNMFVLPSAEEMKQFATQYHLDQITPIIREAAKRGETSVNLNDDEVKGLEKILESKGYQVQLFEPTNRCIISWSVEV